MKRIPKKTRVLAAAVLMAAGLVASKANAPELVSRALLFLAWLLSGIDVLKSAVVQLRKRFLMAEHFLMTVATVGAILIGEVGEAAMVMVLYQLGELIQARAVGKSRASIAGLMDIAAPVAYRHVAGNREEIDPDDIEVGDLLEVRAGERVPADGVVIRGESALDCSALTGESMPISVAEGSQVLSGSINGDGWFIFRAEKRAEDSTALRILELIEEASSNPAETESMITRFAKIYTPIVVACAAALAILPPLLMPGLAPASDWIERGLTFLVVSCPCAFVISVPMAFFSGIGVSSRAGVLVKGGYALELLPKIDALAFDKTGTLTEGSFSVLAAHAAASPACDAAPSPASDPAHGASQNPAPGAAKAELIRRAKALEAGSSHPIAAAIRRIPVDDTAPPLVAKAIRSIPGRGLIGEFSDGVYLLGNRALMEENGFRDDAEKDGCEGAEAAAMVHLARTSPEPRYFGHFVISDRMKPSSADCIRQLREMGIRSITMLTGDSKRIAKEVGEKLGIAEIRSELLPDQKLAWVKEQRSLGKRCVAVVGDGLNDAPVLTAADIGIAMGGIGSDATIEASDVVLMGDDLRALPNAIRIASKTKAIANQNIYGSLGVKLAFLIISALGLASMWMAVFADMGVALIAVMNSFRLFHTKGECKI